MNVISKDGDKEVTEQTPLEDLIDSHGHNIYFRAKVTNKEEAAKFLGKIYREDSVEGFSFESIIMGDLVQENKERAKADVEDAMKRFLDEFKVLTDYVE